MNEIVIAVCGDKNCGQTPQMPYLGERFDGATFTRNGTLFLSAALIRCGFDAYILPSAERGERAMLANRRNADAMICISYAKFGSGKSFNGVRGFRIRHGASDASRTLGEDVCAFLGMYRGEGAIIREDGEFSACPSITVDGGYLTCFDEAKLVYDPDFAEKIAEHVALGVCEFFDMPYVPRDDCRAYPMLSFPRRGRNVRLLQCLLALRGEDAVKIDGVFDAQTDKAVKNFCINNGLPPTGGVNAAVWRALVFNDKRELSGGSKRAAVRYVQQKLRSKLYDADISGTLDKKTQNAISAFARDSAGVDIPPIEQIDDNLFALISAVGGGKPRLI